MYRGGSELRKSTNTPGASGWFGFGSSNASTSTPPGLLRQKIFDGSSCPQALMRTAVAYNTGDSRNVATTPAASEKRTNRQSPLVGRNEVRSSHATRIATSIVNTIIGV